MIKQIIRFHKQPTIITTFNDTEYETARDEILTVALDKDFISGTIEHNTKAVFISTTSEAEHNVNV